MRFGPPRHFVPVCIRHKHGYYGGPAGYQEMSKELARRTPLIILPGAEKGKETMPDTRQERIDRIKTGLVSPVLAERMKAVEQIMDWRENRYE